ncbi:MAG: transglutaminase-like domain-containing protein [Terriglobia bacterium]
MKPNRVLLFSCVSTLLVMPVVAGAQSEFSPPSRTFLFTYQVTLKAIPTGAKRVRIWIPRSASDTNQTVVLRKVKGPVRLRETREAAFGNHILYGEILHPSSSTAEFIVEYQVTRKEYSKGGFENLVKAGQGAMGAPPANLARFLAPDRLVPIDGKMKELADENTRGKQGAVEKTQALYDYVFHTVRYDKSGTGWGRGDSLWVCDAKHGNCTDFHSLFISLARAERIPARFEIGFPLPAGVEGTIPGYHCWAEFFVLGPGWVPVDISEAWKDPRKHDYFFGALDANRVQFSVGRDLVLQPKQDGPPLNYFIFPYVEVDGQPFEGIEKRFSFRDVAGAWDVVGQGAAR